MANFEQTEGTQAEQEKQTDLQRFKSGVLTVLGELNLLHATPAEQAAALASYLKEADRDSALASDEKDMDALTEELLAYTGADFPEFAAQRVLAMLEKEGRYSDTKNYQEKTAVRKNALRGFNMFPGNFAFSYGLEPEMKMAHLHLTNPYIEKGQDAFAGASGAAVMRMFLKGLMQFAGEVVARNEKIETITTTSVILSRPEFVAFLEKLGFKNKGEIEGELKRRHFMGEKRPVIGMEASRESFLTAMQDMDFRKIQAEALKALRATKSGT